MSEMRAAVKKKGKKMKIMFPSMSASILKYRAIPRPQMVWDGKRSPIKFLIIISPAESGMVALGMEEGGALASVCVCVYVAGK